MTVNVTRVIDRSPGGHTMTRVYVDAQTDRGKNYRWLHSEDLFRTPEEAIEAKIEAGAKEADYRNERHNRAMERIQKREKRLYELLKGYQP